MRAAEVLDLMGSVSVNQWGLVTSGQAEAAGVLRADLRRVAKRGLVRRIRHGVYALHGSAADHLEDIRAEWLATDPTRTAHQRRSDADPVVVSDESAATVHGIGDMPAGGVHLTAARRIRPSISTPVIGHQRTLHPREVEWIDGLPVTSVRRTLEDLAGRWEPQHIRDAIGDAIRGGLMPAAEIARSKTLMQVVPEMAPPATHAALRDRLKQAKPADPGVLDEFFRLQLLGLLGERSEWVLKGGTNLICRLTDARSTHDLDLFLDSPASAAESARLLTQQIDGAQVGLYRFFVADSELNQAGHVDIVRLKVDVRDGTRPVTSFTIDVAGAVTMNDVPTRHQVRMPAVVPGYVSTIGIALYPVENQLADKLCAMYQSYGHGRASTRYHDLYDAALIVDQLTYKPETLHAALNTQYQLRGMRPIPADMPEPAPGWAETYNRNVRKMRGTREPFTDYASAHAAVQSAVAPTLTKAVGDDARRKLRTLADRQDEAPQREEPQRSITRDIER